jgi:phage shock protein PspC (stress-responsive transcriptional regulator)
MSSDTDTTAASVPEAEPVRLQRSRDDRYLAGVSGGLARYFGLNPIVYRIGFVVLSLFGGAGVLLYAVAAVIIPAEDAEQSIAEEFLRRHRDRPVLLIGLAVLGIVAVLVLSSPGDEEWFWFLGGPVWFVILVGFIVYAAWQMFGGGERTGEARARSMPRWLLPVLGVVMVVAGIASVLDAHPMPVGLGALLVLSGVAVVLAAVFGRLGAIVALLVVLVGIAGTVVAVADLHEGGGVGERVVRPLTVEQLRPLYRVGLGTLELDLRALELPPGETQVEARVGVGELVVRVPDGVALDATAEVGVGDASVPGRDEDGVGAEVETRDEGFEEAARRLVVDAKVGFGDLRIERDEP